jgi:hypothetical protein
MSSMRSVSSKTNISTLKEILNLDFANLLIDLGCYQRQYLTQLSNFLWLTPKNHCAT